MKKPRAVIAINRELYPTLLSPLDLTRLREMTELLNDDPPATITKEFLMKHLPTADIAITSWFSARLDEEVLAAAPNLKLVCHAAGSVRPIVSETLWGRKIQVMSGAAAIAYGVAEYCLGLMLMASKRVFWLTQGTRQGLWTELSPCFGGFFELYQQKVGVIGAGHIGKHLIRLLRNFDCQVLAYDPYLSAEQAAEMGCLKVETLEELFSQCRVVSLHAPTNESTRHMLRGHHFAALPKGAVFINTAGSIQIHEEEFLAELRRGRFVACVDRCHQEPCALDHPYRSLPNVILSPHIAGAFAENKLRIGTYVVDEIARWIEKKPLQYEVTEAKLATMA